jgi:hypothetical protein
MENRPKHTQRKKYDDNNESGLKHLQRGPPGFYVVPRVHDDQGVHRHNKREAEDRISSIGRTLPYQWSLHPAIVYG